MNIETKNIAGLLRDLSLSTMAQEYEALTHKATTDGLSYTQYLQMLAQCELSARYERSVIRRTRAARIPVVKTLQQFDWSWPQKVDRAQIQELFTLRFIEQKSNVVFIGGVGVGKTHLAQALAHSACLHNIPTLFTQAVEIINQLSTAQSTNTLTKSLKSFAAPRLLIIDELGYIPMDKRAADLLFQVISARYEQSATVITTNMVYKHWPHIFNNDAALTTAILDRVIHHCETVIIEAKSYRTQKNA